MKINTIQNTESALTVNMLSEEQVQDLLDPEANKEQQVQNKPVFTPAEREYLQARNIGTNEADKKASASVDQMVNDIKNELNIKDPSPSEMKSATSSQTASEDALPDKSAKEEKTKITRNTTGIRTFYKGPTTVSYYLEGRYDVRLPIPVYKCQGNGKVVMDIQVNQEGYIVKYEVDRAKSDIPDECILDTAEKAARTTRFNSVNNGPSIQHGSITYIFIAQ